MKAKRNSRQSAGQMKPVTMHDVARASGVSPMTVSRVMSGQQNVDPEKRRRVIAAAAELDYVPNALASSFASNRAGFIGVATPFQGLLGTAFFRETMTGVQRVIEDTDVDFALFDCDSEKFGNPEGLAKIYRQKKAAGLLIVAPRMDSRYLRILGKMGVAFVVLGEYLEIPTAPSVCCDDTRGIEMIMSHLVELGHRRIAWVSGPPGLGTARRREAAYVDFMARAGYSYPPHYMQLGNYTVPTARLAALNILHEPERPTAIVAANDLSAMGVIAAARELGLRVPEDLAVTGFDNLAPTEESGIALTTIHQPVQDIAALGTKRLLEALKTGILPRGHMDVEVSLIVRDSTRGRK